jgi:hypothetical protein
MKDAQFAIQNMPQGEDHESLGSAYTGPVAGLKSEYVTPSADNLYITPYASDVFVHGGTGQNVINLGSTSGTNVADGGPGSSVMVGGSGSDTFFTDARGATHDIWNTIAGFHAGDAATLWGVTSKDFNTSWAANEGAHGYSGETLHAYSTTGRPNVSVTFAGATSPLTTSDGPDYTYVTA